MSHQNSHGLTLMECLLVIVIMSILFCISIVAYHSFLRREELTVLVNRVTDALQYARMQAIETQQTMTYCARSNQNNIQCGKKWQQGQIVVNEKTQQVYRVFSAIPSVYQFQWKSTLGESDVLRWRSNGFTRGQQGSFYLCAVKSHMPSAQIIILRTGRVRSMISNTIPACR